MGGNLFKLGRMPKAKYLEIETEISTYLSQKIGADNFRIPRYYDDKADFGDLDVLVNISAVADWERIKTQILNDLNIQQHKSVGNVFSTVYKNLQVDYFTKEEAYFLATYNFLSFNDVGNIIGRIFRRFNLKYGEKGLHYVFRRTSEESYSKDILITNDFKKIFAFLGLDYSVWETGFASKKELFDWVIASKYFSTKPYLDENKAINKRKKRPTMQAFIAYLKENDIIREPKFLEKDHYLEMIADYFPETNLFEQIRIEKEREKYINTIKQKYNGRIIMELFPEIKGRNLGKFMNLFQAQFDHYEKYFYSASAEEIIAQLKTFHSNYKND
ncbi:hypothetical protein U8527_19940 [Kordia algicida OT-1]|uniref:Uncharacterized protein n=1 Tax=Kordia algicida OT-1 TaxID=391587 RepID=A9DK96_9FLAO|nr:hypothetical protein [Kordia algicida]EDP98281.1 hypothetical protein KAOT1_13727 [Kordia algicida OT-1]